MREGAAEGQDHSEEVPNWGPQSLSYPHLGGTLLGHSIERIVAVAAPAIP